MILFVTAYWGDILKTKFLLVLMTGELTGPRCVFSNSSRCSTCPSSRAWPCLWPHCPWASPLPPCLLSPPALACSPSPPFWPTTPTARPRQWRRTRPGRLQRGLPEERTGTSQTNTDTTRRFGGGGQMLVKKKKRKERWICKCRL